MIQQGELGHWQGNAHASETAIEMVQTVKHETLVQHTMEATDTSNPTWKMLKNTLFMPKKGFFYVSGISAFRRLK